MQKMQETWVWSLGREDPLEEGMATHFHILAWRIPWTEEPGGLQSIGLQRIRHDWVTNAFTFHLSIHPSIHLYLYIYVYLYLFIHPSLSVSIYLSVAISLSSAIQGTNSISSFQAWADSVFPCPQSKQNWPLFITGQLPTLYDFHFDSTQKKWIPWNQLVPEYVHSHKRRFVDILGTWEPKPQFKHMWFSFCVEG